MAVYGLMLVGAISFLDAYMPISNRYLYPAYVATIILAASIAAHYFDILGKTALVRFCLTVLFLSFSGFYLARGSSWLAFSYDWGLGYASRSWRESKLIARVKEVEAHTPLITNGPDAVYLLTGRPAYMLPRKLNLSTGQGNLDYVTQMAAVGNQLRNENGVLIYFRTISWRWYLPREEELVKELDLQAIAHEEDGSVYRTQRRRKMPAER